MNQKIEAVLDSILETFEFGGIPKAVAIFSFPIPDILSTKLSFTNRTIQSFSGSSDSRGYRQWLEVGRQVKKGAKAIYILVPCLKKQKDEETDEEQIILAYFKTVAVFKIEDTEGDPLDYQNIELPELPLIERAYDWGIEVKSVPGDYSYYGYFIPARKEIT